MSSATIKAQLTQEQGKKEELEALKTELSGKKITTTPVLQERNTDGMAGTKYKEQHESMLNTVKNYTKKIKAEKNNAMVELEIKIKEYDTQITSLSSSYRLAVIQEEAARVEASRKAAEAASKAAEAAKKAQV